jgi:hypothetical protein
MIENYQTGLLWQLLRNSSYIISGLRRAGFLGGWLDDACITDEQIGNTKEI